MLRKFFNSSLLSFISVTLYGQCWYSSGTTSMYYRRDSKVDVGHEIAIYGMVSRLPYKSYTTFGAGADYTLLIGKHWGVSIGAEFAIYTLNMPIADVHLAIPDKYTYGGNSEDMEFRFDLTGISFSPRVAYLNIPLMAHYRQELGKRSQLYISAGGKLGLAQQQQSSYTASAQKATTTGYFPATGQIFSDMPNHHFVTVNNLSTSSSTGTTMSYAAQLESGVRWALGTHCAVHTGIWFEYGLPNIAPAQLNIPVESVASFAGSTHIQELKKSATITPDPVHLMAVGLKVKLSWGW